MYAKGKSDSGRQPEIISFDCNLVNFFKYIKGMGKLFRISWIRGRVLGSGFKVCFLYPLRLPLLQGESDRPSVVLFWGRDF
jgi:hypothetical protein